MTNNTQLQLPAEVLECIINWVIQFSLAYHKSKNKDISNDAAEYITDELNMPNAMTEYATKLHALQQEYNKMNKVCGSSISHADDVGEKYLEARALLSKFISRHEAGLLPDRFVYNEIKTFLDGTK
jgi:hypothetical protein